MIEHLRLEPVFQFDWIEGCFHNCDRLLFERGGWLLFDRVR